MNSSDLEGSDAWASGLLRLVSLLVESGVILMGGGSTWFFWLPHLLTIAILLPHSRVVLQEVLDADLSNEAFPFSTHKLVKAAGCMVRTGAPNRGDPLIVIRLLTSVVQRVCMETVTFMIS